MSLFSTSSVEAAQINIHAAVFLVDWSNGTEFLPSKDIITTQISTNVAAFYDDTSYGKVALTEDTFGWYNVSNPGGCSIAAWAQEGRDQAMAAGADLSLYNKFIYVFPFSDCGWAGFSSGTSVYVNGVYQSGLSDSLVAHELGHTFGLGHANTRTCKLNGVFVQASSICEDFVYQDPYDVMGNSSYTTLDATHRTLAGWLPLTNTQAITSTGTYHITPLEFRSNTIQALQIIIPKQGNKTFNQYCVEIRQSYGWDNFQEASPYGAHWGVDGIMIRQAGNCLTSRETYLMDATPNSIDEPSGATRLDQTLFVGKSFIDPDARITIKTIAIDATGATVQVTFNKK